MPSRAVDEAWHEFILDSIAYTRFCEGAFGHYLHHTPVEAMGTPMGDALGETVHAWDRSDAGREESALWDLDERLGIGGESGGGGGCSGSGAALGAGAAPAAAVVGAAAAKPPLRTLTPL
jgi:hypothetical protein